MKECGARGAQRVDELNERLTENVRSAGFSKIGFVRMTGRKRSRGGIKILMRERSVRGKTNSLGY